MKKLAILVLALCLAFPLFAEANSQKIYRVDSPVYQDIATIYLATGHAMPSTTGPWSEAELQAMIGAIAEMEVPSYLKSTYESVLSALDAQPSSTFRGGAMELDGVLSLELYGHTYNGDISRKDSNGIEEKAFAGRASWFAKDMTKNVPFFQLNWETWLGEHFYTYFDAYLSNSIRGEKEIGSTRLNSNIPALQNFELDVKLLDINFPSRAFAAVGGDNWTLQIGRDRLSWGGGSTGNLVLSDNFPYHDMVRATAYSEKYKYTYLLSFFPSKVNYYNQTTDTSDPGYGRYEGNAYNNSTRALQGSAFYAAHRFEGRVLQDRLSFAITEAIVYDSPSNSISFLALSPMYFMHNGYMPNNSNSTLAFEFNWTPVKGLGIYGQMLIDQFAMPGFETSPGPGKDEKTTTDGKAFMLGAKYVTGLKESVLTINPEMVYVMPYTYLRDYDQNYGLDYTGAVRYRLYSFEDYAPHTDILYDEFIIGYTYGPDCLVANLSLQWEKDKLTLGAKAFAMAHGTHDMWTEWTSIPKNTTEEDYKNQYSGITTDHSNTGNHKYGDSAKTDRNSMWYTLDLGVSAQYQATEALSIFAGLDFVKMNNIFNNSANDSSDFQLVLSVSYKPF